jgi:hypothetical protein
MSCRRISDGDSLFRQSVHPLAFKGKRFAWEKCLMLYDEPDGSLLASLTWERYVPTTELVHDYGCRLAFGMNEKKRIAGKLTDKNRNLYCGAYHFKARAIRALSTAEGLNEILSADVLHHVELGEIAHADLRIVLKPGGAPDIEGTKTAILAQLWNMCSGPMKHVCDCDKNISEHPSSSLAIPPAGVYSDTRSSLSRFWSIIRFHICGWLWRNFVQPRNS